MAPSGPRIVAVDMMSLSHGWAEGVKSGRRTGSFRLAPREGALLDSSIPDRHHPRALARRSFADDPGTPDRGRSVGEWQALSRQSPLPGRGVGRSDHSPGNSPGTNRPPAPGHGRPV